MAYDHTIKAVANITGLNKSLVKDIDKARHESLCKRKRKRQKRADKTRSSGKIFGNR